MRGLTRRWTFRVPQEAERSDAQRGGSLLDRLLRARGLVGTGGSGGSGDDAAAFLDPRLTHLHDPSLLPDADRAAERILDAASRREPIVIYGDYDVDGVTATAILHHVILALFPTADVRTYIPHRIEEGYGLNTGAVEELAAAGAGVIVSVDCGVTAVEPALAARRAGVDLIITDHHNPPASEADLPAAYAVVHPRRPGSAYPFGHLCGAGVAYKLAWRLATMHAGGDRATAPVRKLLVDLLALAALGAVADVVPLVGENRVMARFGLERIKRSPLVGLRALVEASGLDGEKIDTMGVGFRLAPRLNACGRMGHAASALELFTTRDEDRARQIAAELTAQNNERRAVEQRILAQALEMAEREGMTVEGRRAVVLAHPEWHPGVVGIVCSRIVDRLGRPAILMREENGLCAGSGRSVEGFNLHGALEACAGMLEGFGGHDMAAGVRVATARIPEFVEAFTERANGAIGPEDLVPRVTVDCGASLGELTVDAVNRLEALAPFGRENPPVRVLVRGVRLEDPPRPMGAHGKHLALRLTGDGRGIRAVAWNWGEHAESLRRGMTVDAVVEPKLSRWNGSVRVEPVLVDLCVG